MRITLFKYFKNCKICTYIDTNFTPKCLPLQGWKGGRVEVIFLSHSGPQLLFLFFYHLFSFSFSTFYTPNFFSVLSTTVCQQLSTDNCQLLSRRFSMLFKYKTKMKILLSNLNLLPLYLLFITIYFRTCS